MRIQLEFRNFWRDLSKEGERLLQPNSLLPKQGREVGNKGTLIISNQWQPNTESIQVKEICQKKNSSMAIQLTHSLEAPGFLQISFRNPRNSSNNCSLGISYCPLQMYAVSFPTLLCAPRVLPCPDLLTVSLVLWLSVESANREYQQQDARGRRGKRSGGLFLLLPSWASPWVSSTPQHSFVRWAQLCTTPSVRVLAPLPLHCFPA